MGIKLAKASLLLSTLLVACAKPNYVNVGGPGAVPGEKATSCQARFSSHLCVGMTWEKMPTESEYGSFILKTFRPNLGDASPVLEDQAGEVAVVLWMPGMGHGSSPVTVNRLDVGTFRASRVFFTMRGEWEIRVQLKAGNEIKDQAIIPIIL